MRRLLAIVILLLTMSVVYTQSWVGSTRLSSPNDITHIQSQIDQDQNIFVFGSFSGVISAGSSLEASSNGGNDYFLCKFNFDGEPIWIKAIGGESYEDLDGGMTLNKDGEILVAGGFTDTIFTNTYDTIVSLGLSDIFLSKYNTDGDEVWIKSVIKGRNFQKVTHLSIDSDDNLILVGQFKDSTSFENAIAPAKNNLNLHGFYSKFSPQDGSMLWWKSIESLNGPEGVLITKSSTTKDQIILIGSFSDSIVVENDTIVSENASKDALIISSNLNGKVYWANFIIGTSDEQAQSLLIDEYDKIYVSGHYNSPFLKPNYTAPDSLFEKTNMGGSDLFMTRFSSSGQLDWLNTSGGSGDERISESELAQDLIIVSGYFSDTLHWGDNTATTDGASDKDLFMGYMKTNGTFKYIKTLSGSGNSHEESKATLHTSSDHGYGIIYSNSRVLQLGDDILSSPHNKFHITLGILGCKTLSIDYIKAQDVNTCPSDSTGSLEIHASGGFGAPFNYSIDAGENYNYNSSVIKGLPKGNFYVAIRDREMCTLLGPPVQISEPDPLEIEVISTSNITANSDGYIVVGAQGGTSPYIYTLLPDGKSQSYGTFVFAQGNSGKYLVEVNDFNLCGPVRTDTIKIRDLTNPDGLEDFSGIAMKIFPNPSTDIVTVEMPLEADEVTMELLNLAGQVVMSCQVFTTGGFLRETLDVSGLAQGMYMLRVNSQTLKSAIVVN